MNRQKKTILIAAIIITILAIAIIAYFLFIKQTQDTDTQVIAPSEEGSQSEITESQVIESEPQVEPATPEEIEFGQVKNLAASFAERFGSYSNQADFQNLIELESLMTQEMKIRTDSFISQSRQDNPTSENYYAQTAKALSTKEMAYDANFGRAEFLVQCQRQEIINSPDNIRTYYQDIKITLLKVSEAWKVDSAEWQ